MIQKGLSILMLAGMMALGKTASAAMVAVSPPAADQAIQLQEEGKYVEALQIYEKLLEEKNLPDSEREKINKLYEDLNIKLLFSRFKGPGSLFYQVKPGDSLYEIAKQYHTTIELLKRSNGLEHDVIYAGTILKVVQAAFTIRVDKSENLLTLLMDEKPLKHYHVSTGKNNSTPAGEFKIVTKLEHPTWYRAGAVVPPNSPDNILGTRWMGFDFPGYGIHGTTEPEKIGLQVTAGCVRMLNEDVEELFAIVPRESRVIITD